MTERLCRICHLGERFTTPTPKPYEGYGEATVASRLFSFLRPLFPSLPSSTKSPSDLNDEILSEDELINSCDCKGTMKYVHRGCLNTWRIASLYQKLASKGLHTDMGPVVEQDVSSLLDFEDLFNYVCHFVLRVFDPANYRTVLDFTWWQLQQKPSMMSSFLESFLFGDRIGYLNVDYLLEIVEPEFVSPWRNRFVKNTRLSSLVFLRCEWCYHNYDFLVFPQKLGYSSHSRSGVVGSTVYFLKTMLKMLMSCVIMTLDAFSGYTFACLLLGVLLIGRSETALSGFPLQFEDLCAVTAMNERRPLMIVSSLERLVQGASWLTYLLFFYIPMSIGSLLFTYGNLVTSRLDSTMSLAIIGVYILFVLKKPQIYLMLGIVEVLSSVAVWPDGGASLVPLRQTLRAVLLLSCCRQTAHFYHHTVVPNLKARLQSVIRVDRLEQSRFYWNVREKKDHP